MIFVLKLLTKLNDITTHSHQKKWSNGLCAKTIPWLLTYKCVVLSSCYACNFEELVAPHICSYSKNDDRCVHACVCMYVYMHVCVRVHVCVSIAMCVFVNACNPLRVVFSILPIEKRKIKERYKFGDRAHGI